MSRALGAAFLNHQVEQLEKSVSNGAASGNWRDRRFTQPNNGHSPGSGGKRAPVSPKAINNRKKVSDVQTVSPTRAGDGRRKSGDDSDKDADVIIIDASVLVHSLDKLKKWSRNGREEVVIVPLEGECSPSLELV